MAEEIATMVRGTADPAFAIDRSGLISAWNAAAETLFGISSIEAVGRPCHEILQGSDEGSVTCSEHCPIQQALEVNRPVENFDLQVHTKSGPQWCNISVLMVTEPRSSSRHAVHIVHPREMRKRFEQLIRDFLVNQTDLTPDLAAQLVKKVRTATSTVRLTVRETEILALLANGTSTKTIAERLGISAKTVNNHISRLLNKLDAHNRLEAVRRADKAGLI